MRQRNHSRAAHRSPRHGGRGMSVERLERLLRHNALDPNAVTEDDVCTQLTSAVALQDRLRAFGGVILGDEVGAGKTFVTFAVLAETLLQPNNARRGAVIFVPS